MHDKMKPITVILLIVLILIVFQGALLTKDLFEDQFQKRVVSVKKKDDRLMVYISIGRAIPVPFEIIGFHFNLLKQIYYEIFKHMPGFELLESVIKKIREIVTDYFNNCVFVKTSLRELSNCEPFETCYSLIRKFNRILLEIEIYNN